ncbi:MAG TPA: TIGR04348 family glycosyltransferase [Planctomycetes bacterium]|nr:TIGR04348 family glycosyltransferase [Planctomycetota bacterium]
MVRPETPGPEDGNRTTANRWGKILSSLGARVRQMQEWDGDGADLLIALHAVKSHASVRRFHDAHPGAPIVLCGTGTDLYLPRDDEDEALAHESLELATRIVVLQPLAVEALPPGHRHKARVILQSFPRSRRGTPKPSDVFLVVLLANVRPVKDPLLAVDACELLPATSRIHVIHAGSPIDGELAALLQERARSNPRFETRGGLPHGEALDLLASSHLLLSTSRQEGGANVLSEALASGVPVVATSIPGSLGILGGGYPALFPPGDAPALANLLVRCEEDSDFYGELLLRCDRLSEQLDPQRELDSWASLLEELGIPG